MRAFEIICELEPERVTVHIELVVDNAKAVVLTVTEPFPNQASALLSVRDQERLYTWLGQQLGKST